jgi:aminopeptidase YwaD
MRHVRKLAGEIGIRTKASEAETAGADYIARKFESYGYEVTIERFTVPEGTSRNVVARWPGSKSYPFVVGGHMDTVPGSPGANDNASGTAAVLELARIFAGTEQANFVHFVAFGAEEYGANRNSHHDGSAAFVRRLGTKGRERLAGMTSVDMIADGRPLLVGNSGIASDVVARTLFKKIDATKIAVRYITLCDCSDHGPFEHAGIPASFAYSGQESNYHSPTDTVPNMVPDDLLRTGKAMRAFIKEVDKRMLDRFRRLR